MDLSEIMTAYGYPVLGILVIGAIYFQTTMRRRPRSSLSTETNTEEERQTGDQSPAEPQEEDVVAFLLDDGLRKIFEKTTIPGTKVAEIKAEFGNLGKQLRIDGELRYFLTKSKEGLYHPTAIPVTMDHPPSEVAEAINNPEVDIVFNVELPKSFMQSWGPILLFVGFVIFIMWTVVMK